MKFKTILINVIVLMVVVVIGLFLCEFAARTILNPSDYLSVEMVHDDILGGVPTAASGFDSWGFRNREVPERTDIVVIGDSHTYGNTATMEDSWPYVLGRLSSRNVYNLGMGGYGPNQYFYLLTTKALELHPRTIIVGLYMGDDFENAFLITYGLEHWAYLRELPNKTIDFYIWEDASSALSWQKQIRVWLSRHSVIYQLVFHNSLLGNFQGEAQIKNAQALYDSATSLNIPEKNILESFLPKKIMQNLDQDNDSIREGMRITFKLLADMNEMCRQNNTQFIVAVIPTKEMVFSDYLENNTNISLTETIDKLIANERLAREKTFNFLNESNISYVDTLPALKQSAGHELYARTAADMHPNKNGYRVIAEAVFEAMNQSKKESS